MCCKEESVALVAASSEVHRISDRCNVQTAKPAIAQAEAELQREISAYRTLIEQVCGTGIVHGSLDFRCMDARPFADHRVEKSIREVR